MAQFNIKPSKEYALIHKMHQYGIKESDIIEKFIRSSGKGGQHINKTSTCVYLKHVPTGIEVKMQSERSQNLNRFLARRLLVQKIEERVLRIQSDRQREIEKIRRQKRRRSRKAKEKILFQKHLIAEKKALRAPIRDHE